MERGKPRCPEHQRQYEALRPTAKERGYDSRWSRLSRDFRQRFPWCGLRADGEFHTDAGSECAQRGERTPAEVTDHIVAMARGGAHYDEHNLEAKCRRCNDRKRVTHEGGFGR